MICEVESVNEWLVAVSIAWYGAIEVAQRSINVCMLLGKYGKPNDVLCTSSLHSNSRRYLWSANLSLIYINETLSYRGSRPTKLSSSCKNAAFPYLSWSRIVVCLCVYLSVCLCVCLCLSVHLSIRPSVHPSVRLSICQPAPPKIFVSKGSHWN